MNDNLPPLPGHPEPHTMVWSRLERETIEAYGKACWDAAIERQSLPAGWHATKTDESTVKHWPITDKQARSLSLAANGDDMVVNGELKYCFRLGELKHLIALSAAPQPQPVQESEYCDPSSTIYKLAEMVMSDCGCSSDHQRLLDRIAARIQSHIDTTPQALAQPQPVPPEGPMAETVEQSARDVAKCLNERDGQGLDLRHVAMLVHYAQQPVQEPVKGWWAHTCPEDGKVDVVNYQLTPADKRAGWVEHEVYTSPQEAQPLTVAGGAVFQDSEGKHPVTAIGQPVGRWEPTPLFPPGGAGVFLERPQAQPLSDERVREIYESTTGLDFYRNFARAIEQAHGIKGTT